MWIPLGVSRRLLSWQADHLAKLSVLNFKQIILLKGRRASGQPEDTNTCVHTHMPALNDSSEQTWHMNFSKALHLLDFCFCVYGPSHVWHLGYFGWRVNWVSATVQTNVFPLGPDLMLLRLVRVLEWEETKPRPPRGSGAEGSQGCSTPSRKCQLISCFQSAAK